MSEKARLFQVQIVYQIPVVDTDSCEAKSVAIKRFKESNLTPCVTHQIQHVYASEITKISTCGNEILDNLPIFSEDFRGTKGPAGLYIFEEKGR